jgi:hypothetical protein
MTIDLLCSVSVSADAELCLRYWARDNNGGWHESSASICEALGLTLESLEERVAASSVAYACRFRCEACGVPEPVTTRAEYERLQSVHNEFSRPCQHVTCKLGSRPINLAATAATLNQRVDFIGDKLETLRRNLQPVDYSRLAFIDAFYLYCILLASAEGRNKNELPAIVSHVVELAPTRLLVELAYSRLRTQYILVPSAHSSIYAFNIGDFNGAPVTFDTERVCWTLAEDKLYSDNSELLDTLLNQFDSASAVNIEELRQILIKHECLGVVVRSLCKFEIESNISLEVGLLAVVENILRKFPVSVIVGVIRQIFMEPAFCKKMRRMSSRDVGKAVSDAIITYFDGMPSEVFSSNIESPIASRILRKGESLMSSVFSDCFLDFHKDE